ncbi:unnamed protein product [Brachionus calyciflorus]|uniref:Uncharacterized protein n=1 Tax=Brachionus calyciflorus TaxID=104777 RepID=A0A814FTN2_9BILA|nr:unnamed protein product [Brachionus calyciflorus]
MCDHYLFAGLVNISDHTMYDHAYCKDLSRPQVCFGMVQRRENADKMFLESNGDPTKDAVLNFSEINDDDDIEESDSQSVSDVGSLFGSLVCGENRQDDFSDQENEDVRIEKDKSDDKQTDQTESLTIQEKNLGSNISIETTSDLELDDED